MEELDFRITEITRVIERRNAVGWHVENMQYKNEFVVVIVLDGETEYMIDRKKYLARKNDILIFPPGILRSGRTDSRNPWSFISVIFRMDFNEEARDYS